MPREKITLLYKFDELPDEAKKNAIENGKTIISEDFNDICADSITDRFCDRLNELGLPHGAGQKRNDKTGTVEWSLSSCQGDGVAFYGKIDHRKFADTRFSVEDNAYLNKFFNLCETHKIDIVFWIRRNSFGHHYSHFNTMSVDCEVWFQDEASEDAFEQDMGDDNSFNAHLDNVVKMFSEEIRDVSHELESVGYDMIEAEYEDENVIAMFEANEYEFTVDGEIA